MHDKPKALRYHDALADAEQRVVDALPAILDGLIARAKDGDTKAAVYLCDRIMGRPVGAKAAPADDQELPYSESDLQRDQALKEKREIRPRIVIPGYGAKEGM
jgi:hypothetical protein